MYRESILPVPKGLSRFEPVNDGRTRTDWRLVVIIEKAMIFFGWCTVINLVVLLLWFLAFSRAHETLYRVHGQWFRISRETFDAIHYTGMAFYKICIILFNLVPMIALRIAS